MLWGKKEGVRKRMSHMRTKGGVLTENDRERRTNVAPWRWGEGRGREARSGKAADKSR